MAREAHQAAVQAAIQETEELQGLLAQAMAKLEENTGLIGTATGGAMSNDAGQQAYHQALSMVDKLEELISLNASVKEFLSSYQTDF